MTAVSTGRSNALQSILKLVSDTCITYQYLAMESHIRKND